MMPILWNDLESVDSQWINRENLYPDGYFKPARNLTALEYPRLADALLSAFFLAVLMGDLILLWAVL